ncbi:MAG TPA: hypothetical protein VIS48_06005 [Candidatus Kryptonia bacterium]
MLYSIHGPYEIPRQNTVVDRSAEALTDLWQEIEDNYEGLPEGCGCYLFALRAGKGITPWYVGVAEKQSFQRECFSPHKISIYNDVLDEWKGTPLLYLVARNTPEARFSAPSRRGHPSARYLELILISRAMEKNPELMNKRDTKLLRDMVVPTILNSPPGRRTLDEEEFLLALQ